MTTNSSNNFILNSNQPSSSLSITINSSSNNFNQQRTKSFRKPTCAIALDCNLEELKRLNGLESLRPYIIKEKCFPSHVSLNSNTP